jgi:hypothetical protein
MKGQITRLQHDRLFFLAIPRLPLIASAVDRFDLLQDRTLPLGRWLDPYPTVDAFPFALPVQANPAYPFAAVEIHSISLLYPFQGRGLVFFGGIHHLGELIGRDEAPGDMGGDGEGSLIPLDDGAFFEDVCFHGDDLWA